VRDARRHPNATAAARASQKLLAGSAKADIGIWPRTGRFYLAMCLGQIEVSGL
jgi:hypothetical protein